MEINSKLLDDRQDLLKNQDKAFLILILLHYNNIISDDKFKGQLKQLRVGKLLTYRNTHKSGIDGKWHNEDQMINILYDIFNKQKLEKTSIELNDMIKYVRLYLNINHNKCLDFTFNSFLKPFFKYDKYNFKSNTEKIRLCLNVESFNLPINSYIGNTYTPEDEYHYNRGYYDCQYEYKCKDFLRDVELEVIDYFNKLKKVR